MIPDGGSVEVRAVAAASSNPAPRRTRSRSTRGYRRCARERDRVRGPPSRSLARGAHGRLSSAPAGSRRRRHEPPRPHARSRTSRARDRPARSWRAPQELARADAVRRSPQRGPGATRGVARSRGTCMRTMHRRQAVDRTVARLRTKFTAVASASRIRESGGGGSRPTRAPWCTRATSSRRRWSSPRSSRRWPGSSSRVPCRRWDPRSRG